MLSRRSRHRAAQVQIVLGIEASMGDENRTAGAAVNLTLNPRLVLRFLLVTITMLTVFNACVLVAQHVMGHNRLFGLVRQFNIDLEANIPTYFSSMQLAFGALVLWITGQTKRAAGERFGRHWLVLAAIFAYLSVDEAAMVHEMIGDAMREQFVLPGIWFYAWYIPYGLLLIGLAAAYWSFFWHLPALVRLRFACAGAVFLAGAVGLEMLGSHLWNVTGWDTQVHKLRMALAYSVEEPLEMLGIALFVYAALDYAATQGVTARIAFGTNERTLANSKPTRTPVMPAAGALSEPTG